MIRRRAASSPGLPIEPLETRRMMSAAPVGPHLIGERLIGPANATTAIVLQFDRALDPATANDPGAYGFGRNTASTNSDNGGLFGSFFPFARHGKEVIRPHASLGTASYDDATHTVTLNAAQPFLATTFLRYIRVRGLGPHAVRDAQGNALVGHGHTGTNAVVHLRFFRTKAFGFTDAQGDRVSLHLKGPGTIAAFLPNLGNKNPIVFLADTTANSSTLTGAIHLSKRSNGIASLQELSGVSSAKVLVGSNFQIDFEQP